MADVGRLHKEKLKYDGVCVLSRPENRGLKNVV